MPRLAGHLAISVSLAAVLSAVCLRLPHVDHATAALVLVMASVGLGKIWGRAEALAAALAGAAAFLYYFLSPRGFSIANQERWVAFVAFVITAIVTGQLAAQSERRRIEAVGRHDEMEKLYKLVNVLLESGSPESTLAQLADKLVEIFAADGVAFYDKYSGTIVRSGPCACTISDEALRGAGNSVYSRETAGSAFLLAPIRHGSEVVGSLGISGRLLSETLLRGIAGRVGLGLARLYAIEKTTQAEVVRRSEELKAAVLDAMAHEIRNPLNSAKLAATTLLSGQDISKSHQREMLTIIDEEVDRMDRFIDEAVQLARAKADELSLHKEPQNMAQLIPAALAEMNTLVSSRPIQMSIPESLPPAECDKVLIARVIKQLLSNAVKYSPDGSPVTVSAEFTGAAIVIDVLDRGPGVDCEERDYIFEKYYRGRAARSGTPGTGLGLASARSIVEAHGGEIWVSSPAAGGAAFHVSLPVNDGGNTIGLR